MNEHMLVLTQSTKGESHVDARLEGAIDGPLLDLCNKPGVRHGAELRSESRPL